MNDTVQRLVNAILRQEGAPTDSTNPGNLRRVPWLVEPQQYAGGYWKPPKRAMGVAGAAHVVALAIARGHTLRELITQWAPPSDHNPTEQYIANVKEWAAIPDENSPLWNFLEDA